MTMMILSMNMLFILMNHPMSMGITLMIQTMLVSLYSGTMMKTFLMSYMLIITMLSGILVLFIYMSTVASNEKFKTNSKIIMMAIIMLTMSMLFLFNLKKMIIKDNYFKMEMMFKELSLIKMFSKYNMMITITMIVYLFLTMIVSTKLINIFEGPMRMKK